MIKDKLQAMVRIRNIFLDFIFHDSSYLIKILILGDQDISLFNSLVKTPVLQNSKDN